MFLYVALPVAALVLAYLFVPPEIWKGSKAESRKEITFERGSVLADHRELENHIKNMFHNNGKNLAESFDEEFRFIELTERKKNPNFESARIPYNQPKNRYTNVLPNERTRVLLEKDEESDDYEDYINANYIDGLTQETTKRYIATQGPLNVTMDDFWRMVWEQRSSIIVMLTGEIENQRPKCDRYWPDSEEPLELEHNTISMITTRRSGEIIERKMIMKNHESGQTRNVTQFQYATWPDHGTPTAVHPMLDLINKVNEMKHNEGPIVVHCSAGIGRSGTFIAVHSIIEKIESDLTKRPNQVPRFNILDTVLRMRQSRSGMVQTKDQYIFCYMALLVRLRQNDESISKTQKNL